MSRISIDGRIESLPIEVQDVLREIVAEMNDRNRRIGRGAGTPEGRVVGYRGDLWQRTDAASAATAIYVFGGTDGALVGWVAL